MCAVLNSVQVMTFEICDLEILQRLRKINLIIHISQINIYCTI